MFSRPMSNVCIHPHITNKENPHTLSLSSSPSVLSFSSFFLCTHTLDEDVNLFLLSVFCTLQRAIDYLDNMFIHPFQLTRGKAT